MIKVTYSDSYQAKLKRIQRLPQMMQRAVSGFVKRDLIHIRNIFHDGIKNNTLRLERLAFMTIQGKRGKGYEKPSSPLYGGGDTEGNRSYANMLNIVKRGKKWILEPSTRKHHSGNITLRELFLIHENGALIKQKRGDSTVIIRIPPRPALLISYRRFLIQKQKDKKEQSKEVRRALADLVNSANASKLKGLQDWENRE